MTSGDEAHPKGKGDRSLPLLAGALLVAAMLLFAAFRLSAGEPGELDRALMLALRDPADPAAPIGPFWLRKAMVELTNLGSGSELTLIVIVAAGLLIVRRAFRTALLLVAATASGGLMVSLLKARFAHPRPTLVDHLVEVQSASFPSAHAANSAIVFLTVATFLLRIETGAIERIYTIAVAILLTLLVGISRVYLGVHWPSDVAAGWMLGSAWAILWWVAVAALTPGGTPGRR
jgi:undecaprenyl-diphosphatase